MSSGFLTFPANYAHGNFDLNSHLDNNGTIDEAGVNSNVIVLRAEVRPAFRDLRDPYHLATGGSLGRIHKGMTRIDLGGQFRPPNDATRAAWLADKAREMRAAFDPVVCLRDSPSTEGAYELTFSEWTEDTVTYPTGRINQVYYARPIEQPRIVAEVGRAGKGTIHDWDIALVCPDPRAYERVEQTLVLSPGTPSGNLENRGTCAAPLKATIVTSGAGSATFTIQRGSTSFILNLSSGAGTYVVVFETSALYGYGRTISKNGSGLFSAKVSAASTWLDVPVGTTAVTISNTTNVTSCTLAWHSARA